MRAAGQRLPERPGADAENQQERGPGAPVADQPGFPALPAVLLQVLPVAEGKARERAAPRLAAFPRAERCMGVSVCAGILPPEFPGAAGNACRVGGEPRPVSGGTGTVGFGFPAWYPSHCVSQGRLISPGGNGAPASFEPTRLGTLSSRCSVIFIDAERCLRALPKEGSICWLQVFRHWCCGEKSQLFLQTSQIKSRFYSWNAACSSFYA